MENLDLINCPFCGTDDIKLDIQGKSSDGTITWHCISHSPHSPCPCSFVHQNQSELITAWNKQVKIPIKWTTVIPSKFTQTQKQQLIASITYLLDDYELAYNSEMIERFSDYINEIEQGKKVV